MQRRIVVMLTVTLFPAAGWSAGAWHAASSAREQFTLRRATAAPSRTISDDLGWSSLPSPLLAEPQPTPDRDLYGNEVSDAVAKYKSDHTGGVYEEHSPATEVARLKPPTT